MHPTNSIQTFCKSSICSVFSNFIIVHLISNTLINLGYFKYSFVPNCRRGEGGGGGLQIFEKKQQKNTQVCLIIRKLPKNNPPPILRNHDNFPPDAFYFTIPPTIRHKGVLPICGFKTGE